MVRVMTTVMIRVGIRVSMGVISMRVIIRGGIRASLYNGCPVESVEALASFMAAFESRHG